MIKIGKRTFRWKEQWELKKVGKKGKITIQKSTRKKEEEKFF